MVSGNGGTTCYLKLTQSWTICPPLVVERGGGRFSADVLHNFEVDSGAFDYLLMVGKSMYHLVQQNCLLPLSSLIEEVIKIIITTIFYVLFFIHTLQTQRNYLHVLS